MTPTPRRLAESEIRGVRDALIMARAGLLLEAMHKDGDVFYCPFCNTEGPRRLEIKHEPKCKVSLIGKAIETAALLSDLGEREAEGARRFKRGDRITHIRNGIGSIVELRVQATVEGYSPPETGLPDDVRFTYDDGVKGQWPEDRCNPITPPPPPAGDAK
jgi:hypothetical protein